MDNPTRLLDPAREEAPPEHATQRLTPAAPAPAIRPCLRCGSALFKARVRPANNQFGSVPNYAASLNVDRVTGERTLLGLGRRVKTTRCSAWVCPDCGYTELVAVNPRTLLET